MPQPFWLIEAALERGGSISLQPPDGTDVIHGTPLEEPYFAKALPVVKEQLKKAGVRLALLMNAAADGTLPPNLLQLSE
jgi:hypothetical protein